MKDLKRFNLILLNILLINSCNNNCNLRGICSNNNICICYDSNHYWSSEDCLIYHLGPQLESGQICTPNIKNYYCKYKGTCNSDGTACICDDSYHRYPSESCSTWHTYPESTSSLIKSPTLSPTLLPTILPTNPPTKVPSFLPTKLPTNSPTITTTAPPTSIKLTLAMKFILILMLPILIIIIKLPRQEVVLQQ